MNKSSDIEYTQHFGQRFAERVTRKTRRIRHFVAEAYYNGMKLNDIPCKELRRDIEIRQRRHNSVARIYHGYVYWFTGTVAMTIYPLPRDYQRLLKVYSTC